MTTVEEPQHPPGSLTGDGSGRHRSLHAIKYYPGAANCLPTMSSSTPNGWEGYGSRYANGYANGSWGGRHKFGDEDARQSYNDKFRPAAPQAPRQERPPHRSHSERSGRLPRTDVSPGANKAPAGGDTTGKGLCRSNSSLDLDQESPEDKTCGMRREYGSASSIDVMSTSGESFFAMLRDFGNDNGDQRSPGPAQMAELLRGKVEPLPVVQNASNILANGSDAVDDAISPKSKPKFHKLWDMKDRGKSKGRGTGSEPSFFRKRKSAKGETASNLVETSSKGSDNSLDAEGRNEEKLRRKAFAHYDVQSITANLSYASRLRGILSKRRNTTTGASAASMANRNLSNAHGSTEELSPEESDFGDGRSNDLVLSCPFFRNELGGEDERVVGLTRLSDRRHKNLDDSNRNVGGTDCGLPLHRPNMACGLSVVEGTNDTHWKHRTCPYQRQVLQRENVDQGALYYKGYFLDSEHQNWFGIDEVLGPVAVSIRREKVEDNSSTNGKDSNNSSVYQYRLIIRTSELATLRGTILEDVIPNLKPGSGRGIRAREVLDYVAPELQLSCLRLGTTGSQTEEQLLKLDQQGLTNHYKVGILYCRAGQSTEEEMYNNEHAGHAFDEFLDTIGQRVRLKGFDKYRAQLDNKTDSTGLYSVYATFQDCEIMFHVSTMLPYTPNNRQQLLRKRHIGNDIVTIVFQEPDALPFTPRNIRSHFQHVFIVVRALNPCSDNTRYSIAVSRSKEVPVFGPPIPENATFPKSSAFVDFLLAKVINAENAAHRSDKFATMATRTRQEYLKDLATNHVTTTTVDTGPKFPMLSFGVKKKDRHRMRFVPDAIVRGAIVWQVQIEAHSPALDCFLGISVDTLVLIDEQTRDTVFACPCTSVLGWSSQTNSLRVYYHQGECIAVRTKDADVDEIQQIVSRLTCVTQGCETQEFTLRRNSMGHLGFHVQQDGLITEVEPYGYAFKAGLQQNSRLVEICKVVVATSSYDQMVDLLKTSLTVTVTVIPPLQDGSPRRGCNLHNCAYLSIGHLSGGGDYENLHESEDRDDLKSHGKASPRQQVAPVMGKVIRFEQTSSPTRSTPSSGYSSRRSVAVTLEHRFRNSEMTSASSQSSEEKWYDLGEMTDVDMRGKMSTGNADGRSNKESPPPLPARLNQSSQSAFNPSIPRRREPLQSSYYPRMTASRSHDQGFQNSYAHLPPTASRARNGGDSSVHRQLPRSGEQSCEGSTERLNDGGKLSNYSRVGHLYLSDQLLHERLLQLRTTTTAAQSFLTRGKLSSTSSSFCTPDKQLESLMECCHSSRSEDEQSGCSSSNNSLSPRGHRRHPLPPSGNSSGSSSKNQSPKAVGRIGGDSHDVKARLGLAGRQNGINLGSSSSGGSSESTFQEDLLKLINPDLIDPENASQTVAEGFKRPRTPPPIPSKTNSLERISRESQNRLVHVHRASPTSDEAPITNDVILTTARPATVISTTSSSSSPAPSEPRLNKEERLSPRAITGVGALASKSMSSLPTSTTSTTIMPLPDGGSEIDWPSLVDTATKAIEGASMTSTMSNLIPWIDEVSDRLGLDPQPAAISPHVSGNGGIHRIRELEVRVRALEEDLANERSKTAALELEVKQLRDQNNRLQDENGRLEEESQTAASQLRRFTEWFFQSINT